MFCLEVFLSCLVPYALWLLSMNQRRKMFRNKMDLAIKNLHLKNRGQDVKTVYAAFVNDVYCSFDSSIWSIRSHKVAEELESILRNGYKLLDNNGGWMLVYGSSISLIYDWEKIELTRDEARRFFESEYDKLKKGVKK